MTGNFNAWEYWTIKGLQPEQAVNTNWHVNLANNTWVHFGGTINKLGSTFCDNCARGGPAMRISKQYNYNVGWQGDDRRSVVPMLFVNAGNSDDGRSNYYELSPEIQLNPMSQLQLDITGDYYVAHDNTQWLGNFTDAVGKTHYSFARLEQRQQSLGLRISYTATPTLSLQLYGAPFASRGEYKDVRELSADPRASNYANRFLSWRAPLLGHVARLRRTAVAVHERCAVGIPARLYAVRCVDARARRLRSAVPAAGNWVGVQRHFRPAPGQYVPDQVGVLDGLNIGGKQQLPD